MPRVRQEAVPIVFREDRDLVGTRIGEYREERGERVIYLSPAQFSLMKTDKPKMMEGLMVSTRHGIKWVMDIV